MRNGSRRFELWFAIAVAGAALLLLVTLLLPLGFDNDLYESMGWALYAYHGLPYIGSWDHNFPGIVFVHWASIALFGASDLGFRSFDLIVHVAFAAVFYRFLRNWLSPIASAFGVLLYALYYASGQWGLAGQRDTYVGFLLMGAASLFVSTRRSYAIKGRAFLMGILCGCAFLMRPTYIFFSISFLIFFWIERHRVQPCALFLAGSVAPIIAFLLPYVFIPNGLTQVWDTIIRFNLQVYSEVHVPVALFTGGRAVIYTLALLGLVRASAAWKMHRRDAMMFVMLSVSALISPIWMGKYFSYHFEPFVLIAIGFSAFGFEWIMERVPVLWARISLGALALVFFAYAYYPHHLLQYYFGELRRSPDPIQATYERVLSDSLFGLRTTRSVIAYVDRVSKTGVPVGYISIFPGMRWRLGRPAESRFTSIVPLVAYQHSVPAFGVAWQRELLDTLATAPPAVLIVSRSRQWWPFVGKTNDSAIRGIPGLDSLIAVKFIQDTVIGGYAIYRPR